MTLDAASADMIEAAAAAGRPALHEMSPNEMRAMNRARTPLLGTGPDIDVVQDLRIRSADDTAFPVRLFQPADPRGVIVYCHGGGWMTGDLDGFDTLSRTIADRTRCTVLLVDYRKAPEHPFPAAYDDVWEALSYAAEKLARDVLPLIIAGDSSGGNLAAAIAQRAAGEGSPTLAFQALIYPVTDAEFDTASYHDPSNALFLTREAMQTYWDAYVPDTSRRVDPRVAPLRGSVVGTPPALVILAEHDVLRDEGSAYAQRLRGAGISVEEHTAEGQMHGFFTLPNLLPGQEDALEVFVDAIRRML